jgi:hypothetical protein
MTGHNTARTQIQPDGEEPESGVVRIKYRASDQLISILDL